MGAFNSRPKPVIQTFTEAGENERVRYAVSSRQDRRRNSKDTFAAVPDLDGRTSFFGVYDGHEGGEVALLCATQFHTELRNNQDYQINLASALERTFFRMDRLLLVQEDWKELLPRDTNGWMRFLHLKACVCDYPWPFAKRKRDVPYLPPQVSGSTACVAAIRGHQIIIGNAGRSRCIISRNGQATELTTDHEPSNLIERARIESAGGQAIKFQVPGEAEGFFQQQGSVGTYRIDGMLAHSRAIGYFAYKKRDDLPPEEQQVTCNPEIHIVDVTNDIDFLVIVSDGICPYLSSQDVVTHIRTQLATRRRNLRFICEELCDRCLVSGDNATVIVVQFRDAPPPPQPVPVPPQENLFKNDGGSSSSSNNNAAQPPAPASEGHEAQPLLKDEITEDPPAG